MEKTCLYITINVKFIFVNKICRLFLGLSMANSRLWDVRSFIKNKSPIIPCRGIS